VTLTFASYLSKAHSALLLPARGEKVGMRGRFRESEPLRIVERPPHPRRTLVFRLAVPPSPRKRGEVRFNRGKLQERRAC